MNARLLLIALLVPTSGSAQLSETPCTLADISIKSVKASFRSEAGLRIMRGLGVLTNRCREEVGVEIKVTGYDGQGQPVTTKEGWPASIRNIPPGDYPFSLDHWLSYDPTVKTFQVAPIRVKRWR